MGIVFSTTLRCCDQVERVLVLLLTNTLCGPFGTRLEIPPTLNPHLPTRSSSMPDNHRPHDDECSLCPTCRMREHRFWMDEIRKQRLAQKVEEEAPRQRIKSVPNHPPSHPRPSLSLADGRVPLLWLSAGSVSSEPSFTSFLLPEPTLCCASLLLRPVPSPSLLRSKCEQHVEKFLPQAVMKDQKFYVAWEGKKHYSSTPLEALKSVGGLKGMKLGKRYEGGFLVVRSISRVSTMGGFWFVALVLFCPFRPHSLGRLRLVASDCSAVRTSRETRVSSAGTVPSGAREEKSTNCSLSRRS